MTPIQKVLQAFQNLPVTIAFADPNAAEPVEGEPDERWISISHDLVDHESGVQASHVTEEALAAALERL